MAGIINTEEIGKLGFGYMRLPRKGDAFDMELVKKMADTFLESGGTYFDAAFIYTGAEAALRESVIQRHPREKIQIATKLALSFVKDPKQFREQFNVSMDRLGTDYLDFYLLHGMDAESSDKAEDFGAWAFFSELKAKGLVRHIGFSFHAPPEELEEILSKHPETEFVQLQINYLDWDNPGIQSRKLYEIARKYNTPIVIMEPVKGGLLASDTSQITELLRSANPNASMASWALRYAAQLEGVFVTLSGMSTYEQLLDNINTFADLQPISDDEQAVLDKAAEILKAIPSITCTSCRYCVDSCPSLIHIPKMFDIYNNYLVYNTIANLDSEYRMWTRNGGKAGDCTSCRVCESICTQKLEISDKMAKISELFD